VLVLTIHPVASLTSARGTNCVIASYGWFSSTQDYWLPVSDLGDCLTSNASLSFMMDLIIAALAIWPNHFMPVYQLDFDPFCFYPSPAHLGLWHHLYDSLS